MEIQWWYWIVAGVALLLAELAIPLFVLVWLGLSAVAVGLLLLVLPNVSFTAQLTMWLLLSGALVFYWFRIFKPGHHKTRIGMADANVTGEIGLLVNAVEPFGKGQVRFQKPLLGSETWTCIADSNIAAGERVRVVSVEGTLIKIEKA